MKVSPGYKQTDVGIIPEDWDIEPLGTRASFKTGPFGSTLHQSDYVDGGIPVINPMHINDGRITPNATMSVSEEAARRLTDFRMKPGEIIIGRRGDMGRCAVVDKGHAGWMCGTGSMLIRPRLDHPDFLQRILSSTVAIKAIEDASVGSTMINLNQATLSRLNIQIPTIEEQDAIATALSDMDALLDGLDRLIAKKRAIKQATMQQLLTGQTRLPGFSGEWEVKRLGDFVSIRNQKVLPTNVAPETLCVELEHIGKSDGRLLTKGEARNSSAAKYRFQVDDILFGRLRSYLRKYWLATEDGICTTEIWPLMFDLERINSGFLFALVQTDSFIEAASISYGTHMPRADWSVVRNHEIHLPSKEEQAAIATVLSDMDTEITALETRRIKTRALKQAMMQELLTGRTRLV